VPKSTEAKYPRIQSLGQLKFAFVHWVFCSLSPFAYAEDLMVTIRNPSDWDLSAEFGEHQDRAIEYVDEMAHIEVIETHDSQVLLFKEEERASPGWRSSPLSGGMR